MKFNYVARTRNAQIPRKYPHISHNDRIPPALMQRSIVCANVQKFSFHCAKILLPQLLDMDQRPLPFAKSEMLQTRDLQIILFLKRHEALQAPTRATMLRQSHNLPLNQGASSDPLSPHARCDVLRPKNIARLCSYAATSTV